MINKFWNETIKGIEPYTPGEQPKEMNLIKLNTNENPYPPSPKVIEAINMANASKLRLYPDPTCKVLREAIAKNSNLDIDQVFVGNGSDEVLALVFLALLGHGKKVLFPDITYSFYPVYCDIFNILYECIPLKQDFSIQVQDFRKENGGIIICNPNAPTGKALSIQNIKTILDFNKDSVVVIDEAYIDFGAESVVPLIEEYENLLVVQTLSKSRSLAGLRVGYAMGNCNLIAGLEVAKNSFNSYTLDSLAIAGGCAAILDHEYFDRTRREIMSTRDRVVKELEKLGFQVIESKANFIFASHSKYRAVDIYEFLRKNSILVRYFNKPRISEYLRISIGTNEEMNKFINTIECYINAVKNEVS